jgi:hypothetical protein
VRKLEAVQRTFTYRICGMRELDLNYWEKAETPGTVLTGEEKREVYHTARLEDDHRTGSELLMLDL